MNHRAILNIAPRTDLDGLYVGAQDARKPDTAFIAQRYPSNHSGIGGHKMPCPLKHRTIFTEFVKHAVSLKLWQTNLRRGD
jgi:hypothetical protein